MIVFLVGCASEEKRSAGKPVEEIKNEDFKRVVPVQYSSRDDYYKLKDIERANEDALLEETLQRLPESSLDNVAGEKGTLTSFTSHCYKAEFKEAFLQIDHLYDEYRKHPGYWNQVGTCYNLKGDLRKARLFYQKSLDLDKSYAPAFNNIGVLHLKKSEYEKAVAAFTKARELSRFSLTPTFNLAFVYLSFGVADKAKSLLLAVNRQKPGDGQVLGGLGTAEIFLGDFDKAVAYFESISSDKLKRPSIGLNYALALRVLGQKSKAEDALDRVSSSGLGQWQNYYSQVKNFVEGN